LVTRGNVAIYCYNALTAKTWDVTSSEDGKLTSSKTSDTILAKYFSDFVNDEGEMKLVEEATVVKSGANTTEYGKNQIVLSASFSDEDGNEIGIAGFINAEKAPKKDKEEVTYKKDTNVVAYVPTGVANIANLAGKKVDVIFGADNEVAYLVVTDDSVEGSYVTALDNNEIEIDGEEYDLASDVTVAIFGYVLNTEIDEDTEKYTDGITKINALFDTIEALEALIEADDEVDAGVLYCINEDDEFERNIVADVTFNGDDEIETINFKFSVDGFSKLIKENAAGTDDDEYLEINEFIVEKISSKNVLTVSTGNSAESDLDDYEDAEPRVIKNGEVAEVADIKVGDVVTEVVYDGNVKLMIVVSNTVEGTLSDLYKNAYEIDGEEYKVVVAPYYNEEGEIDELHVSDADTIYDSYFEDEEVTAYLNMAGEVVAVIGETEATGTVLGVVTNVPEEEYDEDNEVTYYKAKILAEDGTNRFYKLYKNSKKNKDLDESPVAQNDVIIFEANADREIIEEDITVVADDNTYDINSNEDLLAEIETEITVSTDPKKINDYRFSSSTVVINPVEKDIIAWDALINKSTDPDEFVTAGSKVIISEEEYDDLEEEEQAKYTVVDADADELQYYGYTANTNVYLFSKDDTKVVYVIAWIDEDNYGVSDTQYGILLNVDDERDEDDEKVWFATLLVDGEEVKYECESSLRSKIGSFVSFDVSDDEIDELTELTDKDVIEYIDELRNDTMDLTGLVHADVSTATSLKSITVDYVDVIDGDTYVACEKYDIPATYTCESGEEACASGCVNAEHERTEATAATTAQVTYDLADDYVVYSLSDAEMADEINEGDYIFVIDTDATEDEEDFDGYEIVVVL